MPNPETDYAPARDGYDLPELQDLIVWPDEIRIGDYYGGFEVTQVSKAEHYKVPAVRLTLELDPELRDVQNEIGRAVIVTDRRLVHGIPIKRPIEQ